LQHSRDSNKFPTVFFFLQNWLPFKQGLILNSFSCRKISTVRSENSP